MNWKSVGWASGVGALCLAGVMGLGAQGDEALSGAVTSTQEGKMEGVLVTARRDGAKFDVTVVTDPQGKYSFPKSRLSPGPYTVKIRATGYELASPNTVDVTDKGAALDLKLDKARDLSRQLTSAEWLLSLPGTDAQKSMVQRQIESCTYCHTLERIVKSKFTAAEFPAVITRMAKYYPDGTVAPIEGSGRWRIEGPDFQAAQEKNPSWGYAPGVMKTELGAYLGSINMSGGRSLPSDLKTLPRPTGKGTKVIITQYDMPRKSTVPHDSDIDAEGNIWYADQSDYYISRFEPKTGTFTEWPLPKADKKEFGGGSDVTIDRKGRAWFTVTHDKVPNYFGMIGVFDPKVGQFQFVDLNVPFYGQFTALAPDGALILSGMKIDTESRKLIDTFSFAKAPNTPPGPHMGYEPAMDSSGNWYITDFGSSYIIRVDAKTKAVSWFKTPTAFSEPRRARMDSQDRLWFAEYTADKIGMLDTKTNAITEYDTGIKWGGPYTVSLPDAKGRVYTPSSAGERLMQIDTKTHEVVTYLMPSRDFDVKQISLDPATKSTVYFANVRNARIVKVEPLD